MDKLLNFIWNSRFDGWIDCIHDSTIQMGTDTDTDLYMSWPENQGILFFFIFLKHCK